MPDKNNINTYDEDLDTYSKARFYGIEFEMTQLLKFRDELMSDFPRMKEIFASALKKYGQTLNKKRVLLPDIQPYYKMKTKDGKTVVIPRWMEKCYDPNPIGIFWDHYYCKVYLDAEGIKCYTYRDKGKTQEEVLVHTMSIDEYVDGIKSYNYLLAAICFLKQHLDGRLLTVRR